MSWSTLSSQAHDTSIKGSHNDLFMISRAYVTTTDAGDAFVEALCMWTLDRHCELTVFLTCDAFSLGSPESSSEYTSMVPSSLPTRISWLPSPVMSNVLIQLIPVDSVYT